MIKVKIIVQLSLLRPFGRMAVWEWASWRLDTTLSHNVTLFNQNRLRKTAEDRTDNNKLLEFPFLRVFFRSSDEIWTSYKMQTGRLPKITLAAIVVLPMAAKNSKLEHLKEDIAALSSSFFTILQSSPIQYFLHLLLKSIFFRPTSLT